MARRQHRTSIGRSNVASVAVSWSSSSCTCTLLSRWSRFVTVGTIVAAASSRSTTESAGVASAARSSIFMENRGPWGPCAARGITVPRDATTLVREFWFRSLRPAPRREAPCAHALTHASSSRSISFSLAVALTRPPPWHPPSRSLRLSCVSSSTPPWSNTTTVVAYIPPSPRATFSLSSSRSLALFPCLVPLLLARPHFLSFLVFLYVISGLLETFYLLFSSSRMARGCWLGKGEGESHCHGVSFRVDKGRRLDSIWSPVLDQRTRISMKIKLVESMKDSEKNGWMSSTRGWAKVWN